MSTHLLSTGTGTSTKASIKYIRNDVGSTCVTGLTAERNRIVYSMARITISNVVTYRFNKYNMITGEMTKIGDITHAQLGSPNTYYGSMLVDDNYIYLGKIYNSNSYITRIDINDLENGIVTYRNFGPDSNNHRATAYHQMQWYDDDKTIIVYAGVKGLVLFDTVTELYTYDDYLTSTTETYDGFAIGEKLIVFATGSQFLRYFNKETRETDAKAIPIGSGVPKGCVCYDPKYKKFYVAYSSGMFIFDEETAEWDINEETGSASIIAMPFGNNVKRMIYSDGIVYVFVKNVNRLWFYDTNEKSYYYKGLTWTLPNDDSQLITPCVFERVIFFQHITFAIANYMGFAKYNVGYKVHQYNILLNATSGPYHHKDEHITLNESSVSFVDGTETKEFTELQNNDIDLTLKTVTVNQNDYNKIKSIKII